MVEPITTALLIKGALLLKAKLASAGVAHATAVAVTALAVGLAWKEFVEWYEDFKKIEKTMDEHGVLYGTTTSGRLDNDNAQISHKFYYKEDGDWIEETTTRPVTKKEVPSSILKKINDGENDITEEMELALKN